MQAYEHLWVIVLAAGEGKRLQAFITDEEGRAVPKQYCSVAGDQSMLRGAIDRAQRIVPRERIVTVVACNHEALWRAELNDQKEENIIVQPRNRGTAAGVLLPLVEIMRRDPQAEILVFPSDHHIEDESVLTRSIHRALQSIAVNRKRLVLLGMVPDALDTDYGWIMPSPDRETYVYPVNAFVEKPDTAIANKMRACGGLWNSFIFAVSGRTLLELYASVVPQVLRPFMPLLSERKSLEDASFIEGLYEALPMTDFSRDLLESSSSYLWVLPVPPCGWTDLGTPVRLLRCMHQHALQAVEHADNPYATSPSLYEAMEKNLVVLYSPPMMAHMQALS